jgi:outer membrane protein
MKKLQLFSTVTVSALLLLAPTGAISHEAGDIIVRVGAASVRPEEESSTISTTATGALASTSVDANNNTQLGLNLVYMISDNFGIEVLAATPFEHDLTAAGLDLYGFNTTDLGSSKQLPPTVTAQYYFGSAQSSVRPYIGIGVNYTTFFSKDLSRDAKTELAANSLDLDDSFGLAARAGVDFILSNNWILNASLWKINIETDASFDSALGKVKVGADLNPWVYMVSLGYKF